MAAKKKPQFDADDLWQSIIRENPSLSIEIHNLNSSNSENAKLELSAIYVAKAREALGEDATIPLPEGMSYEMKGKTVACIEGTADVPTEAESSPEEEDKRCLWKGRTDGSPAVITPELDTATETAVAQLRDEAVTVSNVEMDATILLAETRGLAQQAQFIETVSRMTTLTRLASIKEQKTYKGAQFREPSGNMITVKTWPEFCTALGMSRSRVDEDLNNLSVFGDNLLKMQDALGIGYRELRKLRAGFSMLDDASRALALEEVKNAGDKEELLAALDEMGVRNAKLTQANKEKDEQRASLDKLLGESRRKEYELQRKLDAMERPVSPDEEARSLIWMEANMKREIDDACRDLVRVADALAVIASNTFNCGNNGERWRSLPEERHAQMVDYVNERVSSACGRVRDSLLNTGVDVDLALVFDPEAGMDASDGADSADTLQEQAEA